LLVWHCELHDDEFARDVAVGEPVTGLLLAAPPAARPELAALGAPLRPAAVAAVPLAEDWALPLLAELNPPGLLTEFGAPPPVAPVDAPPPRGLVGAVLVPDRANQKQNPLVNKSSTTSRTRFNRCLPSSSRPQYAATSCPISGADYWRTAAIEHPLLQSFRGHQIVPLLKSARITTPVRMDRTASRISLRP
jgi:hypothetical protein